MYDSILWRRARCSKKEKMKIVPLIETLTGLAVKARMEGLLALDDDMTAAEPGFLKKGLRLMVDGTDPGIVREILTTLMYAGGYSGRELLTRMIITDGVLGIQSGLLPELVRERMYAYLGDGFGDDYDHNEYLPEPPDPADTVRAEPGPPEEPPVARTSTESAEEARLKSELLRILSQHGRIPANGPAAESEIRELSSAIRSHESGAALFIRMLKSLPPELSGTLLAGFERYDPETHAHIRARWIVFEDLASCDDRSLQKILREVDTQDLVKALKGASRAVIDRVCSNMSNRAAQLLKEDMEYIGPVRRADVEQSQSRILKIAVMLEEAGEIVIVRQGDEVI